MNRELLSQLRGLASDSAKRDNWNMIFQELSEIGLDISEGPYIQIVEGNTKQHAFLYDRLEEHLELLCGTEII